MNAILFAIIPFILLFSVGTSIVMNANLLNAAEETNKAYENEINKQYYDSEEIYDRYYDDEEEDSVIDIGGEKYSTVEDYLNGNPMD